MKPLISLENVTIRYGSVVAVENVSFEVNEGDYLCVIGGNGAGKSALLKGILGLHPLSGGRIELFLPKNELSYLPQTQGQTYDFPATVFEVALLGRQRTGRLTYSKQDRAAALEALRFVEMADYADKRIGELSGGQRQRVMLARALCRNPRLIFMDEPSAGLDTQACEQLYDILNKLNKTRGVTVVLVSHELNNVVKYAGLVAVMAQRLKFYGTVEAWKEYHRTGEDPC